MKNFCKLLFLFCAATLLLSACTAQGDTIQTGSSNTSTVVSETSIPPEIQSPAAPEPTASVSNVPDTPEESAGEAIRQSGVPREEIFVTTKLYPSEFSNAEQAIDECLSSLDIGYIDLLLLHHPGTGDVEAYHALEQAVADGKVRSIGLSNWYIEELEDFLPKVNIMPAVVQNEIHPYYQGNEVIPYIQNLDIVVEGWFPFGGRGHTRELFEDEVIASIAQAHNVTSAQVILRWNLQKGVVVIPGSGNPDHVRENLDVFGFELTEEEMSQINGLDRGEKHEWY